MTRLVITNGTVLDRTGERRADVAVADGIIVAGTAVTHLGAASDSEGEAAGSQIDGSRYTPYSRHQAQRAA